MQNLNSDQLRQRLSNNTLNMNLLTAENDTIVKILAERGLKAVEQAAKEKSFAIDDDADLLVVQKKAKHLSWRFDAKRQQWRAYDAELMWDEHDGSACPVPANTLVMITTRDGNSKREPAPACDWYWVWHDRPMPSDITHYKTLPPGDELVIGAIEVFK